MTTIGSGATPVDGGTAQAATAEVGHDTGRTAAPPLAPEQVYGTEPLLKRLGDYRVLDEDDDDPVLLTADGRPVDTWREGYPYDERMARTDYEREKRLLQIELLKLQNWMKDAGGRLIVLFEGRRRPVRRKVRESARYAARR